MAILQTIPSCVMGGVCLTLYGFIAVSGLKMFKDLDLGENKNLFERMPGGKSGTIRPALVIGGTVLRKGLAAGE
jgi:hypothetical protein